MRIALIASVILFGIAANAAYLAPWDSRNMEGCGSSVEAALGYGFAGLTAETGAGAVAGVAVGLHGTDTAIAGYYTMVNGVPQDVLNVISILRSSK